MNFFAQTESRAPFPSLARLSFPRKLSETIFQSDGERPQERTGITTAMLRAA